MKIVSSNGPHNRNPPIVIHHKPSRYDLFKTCQIISLNSAVKGKIAPIFEPPFTLNDVVKEVCIRSPPSTATTVTHRRYNADADSLTSASYQPCTSPRFATPGYENANVTSRRANNGGRTWKEYILSIMTRIIAVRLLRDTTPAPSSDAIKPPTRSEKVRQGPLSPTTTPIMVSAAAYCSSKWNEA